MSEHGNAPVQNFYGPDDPLPRIPYGPVRRHWVSTLIVGLIVLLFATVAATASGFGGVLCFLGLPTLLTGIYVAITGRKSWAHVPGGRRAGVILIGASVVLLIIGGNMVPTGEPGTADIAQQSTPAVEPEQAPPAPEPVVPAPAPAPEPVYVAPEPVYVAPEPVYVAPEPEPVYEAPAPAQVQYADCPAVKAAGAAPIHVGDPGWNKKFDKDGDGTGCELKK